MTLKPKFSDLAFLLLTVFFSCACVCVACAKQSLDTGFAAGKTQTQADQALGAAIVQSARAQLGASYKLGGYSPKTGFDCSGLILWAYHQNGLSVPRNAKAQAGSGRAVTMRELAPGDIVVFRIKLRYHTGLYSGGGTFIHSPSNGSRVRQDSLADPYWKDRFVSGRRVI